MRHSLPVSSEALRAAEEVVRQIEAHGRLDFDVPLEAATPLFSADYVWTKGSGRMLGVLIACEQEGCSVTEDIVLRQDASSAGVTGVVLPGGERLHALEAFSSAGVTGVVLPGGERLHALEAFSAGAGVVLPGGEQLYAQKAFSAGAGEVPESGGPRLHILKAFSGQMTESWLVPG